VLHVDVEHALDQPARQFPTSEQDFEPVAGSA
jgi:hypothetical protein